MSEGGLTILLLCALACFWWESRGVAECAVQAARNSCLQAGVTFLNDTVVWKKIRLKRNPVTGRIQFQRTYLFEFTSDFQIRSQGEIEMLGKQVSHLALGVYRVVERG